MGRDGSATAGANGSSGRVRRLTLSQAIAEELASRIRTGQYGPGDGFPTERDLMEQFDVGRSSARESMQALVAMGLLDVRPGRGARVISVDSRSAMTADRVAGVLVGQAVEDLYEFRASAETEVAALAAARATRSDQANIEAALKNYRSAVKSGVELFDADIRFHSALAVAAHNVVFEQVLDGLTDLLNFARREVMTVSWVPKRALREHERIARAVLEGDADAARDAMRRHIAGAVKAVRQTQAERSQGAGRAPSRLTTPAS
ncbi:MAG: FadR/GntR family transcriptional regulator [Jatrophihabitans sp.]